MAYADGIEKFVETVDGALPPDFYTYPVERQRVLYDALTEVLPIPVPEGVRHRDATVTHGGRTARIRVYEPARRTGDAVLFYIRGGGFVIGSLHSHHSLVAELADRTGLVAIALDFGMAPENAHPGPLEDCYAGLCGTLADLPGLGLDGIDPHGAVLCGESSGANMAVILSMMSRDRGGPRLRGEAVISPVLDFTRWRHGGEDAPCSPAVRWSSTPPATARCPNRRSTRTSRRCSPAASTICRPPTSWAARWTPYASTPRSTPPGCGRTGHR